jgi:tetratricopeptide (TPR) repeat protein
MMEMQLETAKSKIDLVATMQIIEGGKTLGNEMGVSQGFKDSLYSVAVVDYEAKRYTKAIQGLHYLVMLDHGNADYWALLGNAFKDSGKYPEALMAWNMAMGITPNFKTAMVIARVAIAIKDKNWAREGLMMSLAHLSNNPKDREDYQKLMDAYEQF